MTTSIPTIAQQALRRLGVRIVPLDDSPTLTEMVPVATIATMALVELGVIASDETPLPSDQALALDKVASVHAALDAQGAVWWDSTAVPRAFVEEYVKLVAGQSASSFGKTVDPQVMLLLEARVRKGAMVLSSDDIAGEHVQAVHDDLAMRDLVHWSSQDIPDAVGDAYSWLAANRMAPLFEQQANPQDAAAAMAAIYRYLALPTSGAAVQVAYF